MVERLVSIDERTEESGDGDRRRERSTIDFPYNDLEIALEVARTVHQRGGQQLSRDQLAAIMGHDKAESSTFRIKVSSARMFGLVDAGRETVTLTPLGRRSVDPQRLTEAKAEAFLRVPLFKDIYEKYRGHILPPDIGLEGEMVDMGVAFKQKDRARQVFQRSADQAGYFSHGRNRLVQPIVNGTVSEIEPPSHDAYRADAPPSPLGYSPGQLPSRQGHDGGGGGGGESGNENKAPMSNKLIQGLVESLPPIGTDWAEEERAEWAALAELIFKRVYKRTSRRDTVVDSQHERTWETEGQR